MTGGDLPSAQADPNLTSPHASQLKVISLAPASGGEGQGEGAKSSPPIYRQKTAHKWAGYTFIKKLFPLFAKEEACPVSPVFYRDSNGVRGSYKYNCSPPELSAPPNQGKEKHVQLSLSLSLSLSRYFCVFFQKQEARI